MKKIPAAILALLMASSATAYEHMDKHILCPILYGQALACNAPSAERLGDLCRTARDQIVRLFIAGKPYRPDAEHYTAAYFEPLAERGIAIVASDPQRWCRDDSTSIEKQARTMIQILERSIQDVERIAKTLDAPKPKPDPADAARRKADGARRRMAMEARERPRPPVGRPCPLDPVSRFFSRLAIGCQP